MRINHLQLENFKCFKSFNIAFNSSFSLLTGDNGVGKTSILEGLCVAAASFFIWTDHAESRDIRPCDVHISNYEEQYPVRVSSHGEILGRGVEWMREKRHKKGTTTRRHADALKKLGRDIQGKVRSRKNINLPVIAYYSVDSPWKRSPGRRMSDKDLVRKGSRFRGYYNGIHPTSDNRFFIKWFRTKELAALQHKRYSSELEVIRKTVSKCVPECENIYFDIEEGRLVTEHKDGKKLPFEFLSDGIKTVMIRVSDIAFRCMILNPHLGENAVSESSGIVLIDELDLHLHPSWQKRIVKNLKETFPSIQFVTTTHSPLLISSAEAYEILRIPEHDGVLNVSPETVSYKNWQLDFILKDIMNMTEDTEDGLEALLSRLSEASDDADLENYEKYMEQLENILHPDDPILTVYRLNKSDLILKRR